MKLLKIILLVFALSSSAHAIVNVTISYNGTDTTVAGSGSWDAGIFSSSSSGTALFTADTAYDNYSGNYDFYNFGLSLTDGQALPFSSGSNHNGDNFGFASAAVSAPTGYSVGDEFSGSFTVLGLNPFGIGTESELTGGTYAGGGNTLIWSVVPEPSSLAAIFGSLALMTTIVCRRKR